jgi:hypothetical protein
VQDGKDQNGCQLERHKRIAARFHKVAVQPAAHLDPANAELFIMHFPLNKPLPTEQQDCQGGGRS